MRIILTLLLFLLSPSTALADDLAPVPPPANEPHSSPLYELKLYPAYAPQAVGIYAKHDLPTETATSTERPAPPPSLPGSNRWGMVCGPWKVEGRASPGYFLRTPIACGSILPYIRDVITSVARHWHPPCDNLRQVTVSITLDADGKLLRRSVRTSSASKETDDLALQAIDKSHFSPQAPFFGAPVDIFLILKENGEIQNNSLPRIMHPPTPLVKTQNRSDH